MTTEPALDSSVTGHADTTIELSLTGMHCDGCAGLIQVVLAEQTGVSLAAVDLDAAVARVTYDGDALTPDALCAAVTELGYGASIRGGQALL